MNESLKQTAIRELAGTTCVCGARKRAQQSFCHDCYYALPAAMRNSLWKLVSNGYAENYDAAKDYLRIHTNRLSPGPLFGGAS